MSDLIDALLGKQKVTKLDAVHRQLTMAIELWVDDKDAVSIHTLVFAAHGVIHDYSQTLKLRQAPLLFDALYFGKEIQQKINQAVKDQAGYFKHAKKDPTKPLYFHLGSNESLIQYTIEGLELIGEKLNNIETTFKIWAKLNYPESLDEESQKRVENIVGIKELRAMGKKKFFQMFLNSFEDT